jgi:hypothetical protein
MKIGNIVSHTKINVSDDFNVVESLDNIIQGLPTLVVGWDYVNKNFPDADIINRKIDDNTYWTFKRNEKRDIYEEDIFYFTRNAYKSLIKDIKYVFIDPIQFGLKTLKKVINKINSIDIIGYYHKDMVYLYGDNIIFGIDLELLEYIGIDRNKILLKISSKCLVFLEEKDIFIEYKNSIEHIDNQVKYIPYIYSIKHE